MSIKSVTSVRFTKLGTFHISPYRIRLTDLLEPFTTSRNPVVYVSLEVS